MEQYEKYTREDFNKEVFGTNIDKIVRLLKFKKNIILQGAPGVGKTYTARRLAYYIMGRKADDHIEQVQFHQSYTYEDFIVGLRPTESGGFKYETGSFYNICKKAEGKKTPYFIIIDEINRGNISMILGEMFSLIEKEYRDTYITLKYNNEKFRVPSNLYIIGTMNTADRGLVSLDYALRRRFSFYTVEPAFKSRGFRDIITRSNNMNFLKLIKKIVELNDVIRNDDTLGSGFEIGHSYFCGNKEINQIELENIVEYDIIPLLDEYWYDDTEKKNIEWASKLRKAINME